MSETIILLDDAAIFQAAADELGLAAREIEPGATGFTQSRRFILQGRSCNLLLLNAADAHPFAYLTLGQRAMVANVARVVCIGAAASLRDGLRPGDLVLVSSAAAVPYPALYESRPPVWQEETADASKAECYQATAQSLGFGRELISRVAPDLWQGEILEICAGYAKHPAWKGGLMPWAPEQLAQLRNAGLDTISEVAVGALEFSAGNPGVPVTCFNLVTGRAEELAKATDGRKLQREWDRHRQTLLYPAVRLAAELLRDVDRSG